MDFNAFGEYSGKLFLKKLCQISLREPEIMRIWKNKCFFLVENNEKFQFCFPSTPNSSVPQRT